jgi:multiple sugar transport system substrate-binding protein
MVPGSAYMDKLQLMLASRTAPDVMRVEQYFFPAIVPKGYFLPLDPLIAREKPGFLDDFVPLALEEGTWNGTLYGMNVLFGPVVIYYNKNLFAAAGLPEPIALLRTNRWNWEAFVSAARDLTRRDPSGRFAQFGTNLATFRSSRRSCGIMAGQIMNPQRTRVVAAEDPQTVEAFQKLADLRWKHHCAPTPADSALSAFTFESGKIAMQWDWSGMSPRYRKNVKSFDWDIVTTPSGPAGDQTVVKGNQLCIHRETRHPDAAWEFVKFMTGPEAEMLLHGQLRRAGPDPPLRPARPALPADRPTPPPPGDFLGVRPARAAPAD